MGKCAIGHGLRIEVWPDPDITETLLERGYA